MALRNSESSYGSVARFLHWVMALAVLAMFGLGLWMRTLDYYSPYYKTAPDLHRSVGIILAVALVLRLLWRWINVKPNDDSLPHHERVLSHLVHIAFYGLLFVLMISGYLISTADGRGIDVFGLFSVPSVYQRTGMEDLAGFIHEYVAYGLMALVGLHVVAALKHHFIDQDVTLQRMLRG